VKNFRFVLVPHDAQWYRILKDAGGAYDGSLAGWRRYFSA